MTFYAQAVGKIFRDTFAHSRKSNVSMLAGSLAFTTVLSLVPLLAVIFFACQTLGYLDFGYEKLKPFLLENLSQGAGQNVQVYLEQFLKNVRASAVGVIGIISLLLTAYLTYNQCIQALDFIFEVQDNRTHRQKFTKGLLVIFFGPIILAFSLGITTVLASRTHIIPKNTNIIAILFNALLFGMTYRFLPNIKIPVRVLVKSSLIMGVIWELTKWGYALYTARTVSYSKFYGSFAAFPIFLLWIYIGWYIALTGAELTRVFYLKEKIKT